MPSLTAAAAVGGWGVLVGGGAASGRKTWRAAAMKVETAVASSMPSVDWSSCGCRPSCGMREGRGQLRLQALLRGIREAGHHHEGVSCGCRPSSVKIR